MLHSMCQTCFFFDSGIKKITFVIMILRRCSHTFNTVVKGEIMRTGVILVNISSWSHSPLWIYVKKRPTDKSIKSCIPHGIIFF